jgi:CBS domain containing-hemolysin-like protein
MRTFLWGVLAVNQLLLLFQLSLTLHSFEVTEFEFRAKLAHSTKTEAALLRAIYKNIEYIKALQSGLGVLALVCGVGLFTHLTGPAIGVLYALAVLAVLISVSRVAWVRQYVHELFMRSAEPVVKLARLLRPVWFITGVPRRVEAVLPQSYDEFLDQLRRIPSTVLKPVQRQRLESILSSEDKVVKDIMTVKKRVVTVEPTATLGPIVLSDLQKSGHGYFPVMAKNGEPEGVLTLADIGDIQLAKQRAKVGDSMSTHIVWAEESASLYELAEVILQEKHYLVLVRNSEGQFSGVVTIADLMKHLVGIVKE